LEPIRINSTLIQALHLTGEDKKILHRNAGRYVGGEMTERGWVVDITQLANSAKQWREQFGDEKQDDI
jgi:hypothetical protein